MLNPLHNQFDPDRLWEMDRDHFLHPWTHFDSFEKEGSLVIAKGQGCHVTDAQGKRYLDGIGGMWCVNVGYGRDELARVMADQAMQLAYSNTFVDVSNPPAAMLAAKLASLAPGSLNRVIYSLTGSAANEGAIRMAQYYHGRKGNHSRKHIISRKNSYHGSTVLTASIGLRDGDRQEEFHYLTSFIHHLSAPYYYRNGKGMTEAEFTDVLVQEFKDKIAELGAENIACFIAEPIQASGGVVPPPPGYLKRMLEVCKQHDILFIADEVVTAFGRIGHMFASYDEFGIQPDMIVMAKGITSGYFPLGATLYSDEIHEVVSTDNPDGWLCGGAEEHRDHGARGHLRSCARCRRLFREPPDGAGKPAAGGRRARQADDDVRGVCGRQGDQGAHPARGQHLQAHFQPVRGTRASGSSDGAPGRHVAAAHHHPRGDRFPGGNPAQRDHRHHGRTGEGRRGLIALQ
jgi:putrescine aminotransferase